MHQRKNGSRRPKKRTNPPSARRTPSKPSAPGPDELPQEEVARALLFRLSGRLEELRDFALEHQADHAVLVTDPGAQVFTRGKTRDELVRWFERVGTEPTAEVVPLEKVEQTIAELSKSDRDFDLTIARMRTRLPAGVLHLVTICGASIGLAALPYCLTEPITPAVLDGPEGEEKSLYHMSLEQCLVSLMAGNPEDVAAGPHRARLVELQRRGVPALAANAALPEPRAPGAVLIELFGGEELVRAARTGGAQGLVRHLDALFAGSAA